MLVTSPRATTFRRTWLTLWIAMGAVRERSLSVLCTITAAHRWITLLVNGKNRDYRQKEWECVGAHHFTGMWCINGITDSHLNSCQCGRDAFIHICRASWVGKFDSLWENLYKSVQNIFMDPSINFDRIQMLSREGLLNSVLFSCRFLYRYIDTKRSDTKTDIWIPRYILLNALKFNLAIATRRK